MDNKGFTLIETLIAVFILAFVLMGLAGHVSTSLKASSLSKQTSIASSLVQDKMEALRNMPFGLLSSGNDSINYQGMTYRRQWKIDQMGNVKMVALVVSYGNKNLQAKTVRAE
jgi:prepilin-type N-terminal cleavage/methylation domain-containing protein